MEERKQGSISTLPEIVTPKEWAEAFKVAPKTVYRMCEQGQLKTVRLRNTLRIVRDESLAMLGL